MCFDFFTIQPFRAVQVLFSPMMSGWTDRHLVEKACPGCISETLRFKILMVGTLVGGVDQRCQGVTLILPLTLLS